MAHAVKDFFGHLARRKQILFSPAQSLEIVYPPKSIPRDIPTEKEIEALLRASSRRTPDGLRDKALFELLYSTGIRRRELMRLHVQDVDLAEGLLTIRDGKGGKDRVVPVGRAACDALSQYLRVRHRIPNGHVTGGHYSTILFLTKSGPLKDPTLTVLVREYMRRSNVRHTTCHVFRHACATHMLRGGADIRMVQELLGHARLTTTQLYTHVTPLDLKEAHRKHHPHGKMDKRKSLLLFHK